MSPQARNEEVVRMLNQVLQEKLLDESELEKVKKLRSAVLETQLTPLAVTGLPFQAAGMFLQKYIDKYGVK